MAKKREKFGIFNSTRGEKKDFPVILISAAFTPESKNVLLKDGTIERRKMREKTFLTASGVKVQTPDANPIILYHTFVERTSLTEYVLAFTKTHIYCWNPATPAWDLKFTCSSACTNWEVVSYNNKVIATNNVDMILVWDTTDLFVPLDNETYGVCYSYYKASEVDETSASGQPILKIADTSDFSKNDIVKIGRDTDREEIKKVDSKDGTSLTFTADLEYEHTSDIRTSVDADSAAEQKVLNVLSTTDFEIDDIIIIDEGGVREETKIIYSIQAGESLTLTEDLTFEHKLSQADTVRNYAGQNDIIEIMSFMTKAKYVIPYENYLIFGYTYEEGKVRPQRIRWNNIGFETDFATGTKGSYELGKSDVIKGFGIFQGFLFAFKGKSHFRLWLAQTYLIFNVLQVSHSVGCKCSHSITNDNKGNLYWLANDGAIHKMGTGAISELIQTEILDSIEPNSVNLIRSTFINETMELCWAMPIGNTLNNKLIMLKDKKWLVSDLAIPAFGYYTEAE